MDEKRYIEISKLPNFEVKCSDGKQYVLLPFEHLYDIPTADVVEVQHGEWIYHECVSSHDGAKSGFSCSVCSGFVEEDIFDMDEFNKDFCGACGAKMDGGNKNDQV